MGSTKKKLKISLWTNKGNEVRVGSKCRKDTITNVGSIATQPADTADTAFTAYIAPAALSG